MIAYHSALLNDLEGELGNRFSRSLAIREGHGRGEGLSQTMPPDAVVFPVSTEEVAGIVGRCNDVRLPVIAFGAGTSLEGQVTAPHGGLSLDLSLMNRILAVHAGDLDCRVEAGVTREQLNTHLRDSGMFFPIDPGANATLGGMAATRASGTNAVRYGTMRDVTLGLTVVTADGTIIQTGGRARKSSAGYDLTRLFVGSEGTLGIITELQLRLAGIPEKIASGVCQFQSISGAVEAVMEVIQCGIPIARIELLDDVQMGACIAYSKLSGMSALPTLFVEFHGSAASVEDQVSQVSAIFEAHQGGGLQWAERSEDRSLLWQARHNAYHAARALAPGLEALATDACVPISRLADCIAEAREAAAQSGLLCPLVGHVGDGNFHLLLLYDTSDPQQSQSAEALSRKVGEIAIGMGGTCTGEHGIGAHKRGLLAIEAGNAGALMESIKQSLDPNGILNPGKTLPL